MITEQDLDNWFTYHPPSVEQQESYFEIRAAAKKLAEVIVNNTPPSADQSAAIRKLRECVMTANAAIACGELLIVLSGAAKTIKRSGSFPSFFGEQVKEQPKWMIRAKETYRFHRSRLLSIDNWTLAKTASALKRSIGSVGEDIMIARWSKTHEKQLEDFDYARDALKFIRKKQREQDLAEI